MKRSSAVRRLIAVLVLSLLFTAVLPWSAVSAKTLEEWLAGFDLGDVWFGDDFAYDITDEKNAHLSPI